jgi:putative transferase (TIGR04331 family)
MKEPKVSTTHILSSFSVDRIKLTDELFDFLIPVLNKLHNTTYSHRFWKLLSKDYINSVISMQTALQKISVLQKPEAEPINGFTLPSFKTRWRSRLTRFVRFYQTRANKQLIESQLLRYNSLTLSMPDLKVVREDLGEPLPVYYPFFWIGDKSKRNTLQVLAKQQSDIYKQNIILYLPGFLVEHFNRMVDSIPLHHPEKKNFHVHNFHSFYNTLLVALYIENGAKLYWYQHGAYYGELIGHNAHYFASSVADKFRTWGWKIRDNDEPWKAYRLEKFKQDYEIAENQNQYSCLICFPGFTKRSTLVLQDRANKLFRALDFVKYPNVLIRPRPGTPNPIRDLDFIVHKNIAKDNCLQTMVEAVHSAHLVVQMTHPSTNTFECMYVDKPVVAFVNNEQPTDVVKPYYEYFLKVGLFHNSIDSLVNHLNVVDIDQWWQSVVSSEEYQTFKKYFLNAV